jgi:hypothetical protein
MNKATRIIAIFTAIIFIAGARKSSAQMVLVSSGAAEYAPVHSKKESRKEKYALQKKQFLQSRFQCFGTLDKKAVYSVTLCADVPDNKRPGRVHVANETGHVFLILSKRDSSFCSIAFGFYPRKPVSSVFFKRVRSKVLLSRSREYEVSVRKDISSADFDLLIQKAIALSARKYDMKKYNCYDYALEIFNALPGIEPLPKSKTKFPLFFGRGGSPCSLYRDLSKLKIQNGYWKEAIEFGNFHSPANCTR